MCNAEITSSTGSSATGASACADRASAPGPVQRFNGDILEIEFDQLADPRGPIDMRDDLEQEIRRRQRCLDRLEVGLPVFEAHRGGGHTHRAVIERSDQRVDFGSQVRIGQFLGKAPQYAPAGIGGSSLRNMQWE